VTRIRTNIRYRYRAFGLRIESDMPLPELGDAGGPEDRADLAVVRRGNGETVQELAEGEGGGRLYAAEGIVAFRVPELAAFRIADGNRIEVYPDFGADEDRIRLYVLGTCMGALLLQRRICRCMAVSWRATAAHTPSSAIRARASRRCPRRCSNAVFVW
jgi:hypothetical protein